MIILGAGHSRSYYTRLEYLYTPLNTDLGEIRLCSIKPTIGSDIVHVELRIVRLNEWKVAIRAYPTLGVL